MINPIEKLYKFCPHCKTPLTNKKLHNKIRRVCPNCSFVFWSNPRPCVTAILLNDKQEVLLLKIASGQLKNHWCMPGGIVEYDEKPQQSLIREVKEETGLDVHIDNLVDVFLIDNDPRGNSMEILYKASLLNSKMLLSHEHSEHGFFPVDKLPAPIAYEHEVAIKKFMSSKQ